LLYQSWFSSFSLFEIIQITELLRASDVYYVMEYLCTV